MNIIEENLYTMLLAFGVAVVVQLFLLRKHIKNIADPLVFFVLSSAFSLSLAIYAVDSIALYMRIVFYFSCFYLGFRIATGRSKLTIMPIELTAERSYFRVVVIIGCLLFFCANLIVWVKSGVILLSPDPSLQKSEAYIGGLGIIRRINWGLGVFILIAAFYWWLLERSIASLIWLCVALLASIAGGGKSSFLPVIFALGLYCLRPFQAVCNQHRRISIRRMVLAVLLLGVVPVAVVLLNEAGSVRAAFGALLVRLFFFGDILLYWGKPDLRAHFSQLGPIDYFRDSLGSILGMLRLSDYNIPIGSQFVEYTLPIGQNLSGSLGPNLPFYVRGELYWGPWFAPYHALIIGLIVGRIRLWFIRYCGHNPLHYSVAAFMVCLSNSLTIDESLTISKFFDFLFVFSFVCLFALLLRGKRGGATASGTHTVKVP